MSFLREVLLANENYNPTFKVNERSLLDPEDIDLIEESYNIDMLLSSLEQFNYVIDGVDNILSLGCEATHTTTVVLETLLLTIGIENFDCDVSTEDKKDSFWKRLWETILKMLKAVKDKIVSFFKKIANGIKKIYDKIRGVEKETKNVYEYVKRNPTKANDQKLFIGNNNKPPSTTEPKTSPILVEYKPSKQTVRRERRKGLAEEEDVIEGNVIRVRPYIKHKVNNILTDNLKTTDTLYEAMVRIDEAIIIFLDKIDILRVIDDAITTLRKVIDNPDTFNEEIKNIEAIIEDAMAYKKFHTTDGYMEKRISESEDKESNYYIVKYGLLAANKSIISYLDDEDLTRCKYSIGDYVNNGTYSKSVYLELYSIEYMLKVQEKILESISILEKEDEYSSKTEKASDELTNLGKLVNRNSDSLREKGITSKEIGTILNTIRWTTGMLTNPMVQVFAIGAKASGEATDIMDKMVKRHRKLNPDFEG